MYLSVLRKRFWWILAAFVVVVGLTALWLVRQPRIYRASTSIVINPRAPQVLEGVRDVVDIGSTSYWSMQYFYGTQNTIISSRAILSQVVERLGLDQDDDFLGLTSITDEAKRAEARAASDAVGILRSVVTVSPEKETWMVWINVEDRDPERAARISTAVAETYRDANLQRRTTGTEDALSWLDEQMEKIKPRLEESENALFEFRKQNDMLSSSLEDRQNMVSKELADLSEAVTQLRTRRIELEARAQRIETIRKEGGELGALPEVARSTTMELLKRDLFALLKDKAGLEERYGAKHPKLIEAQRSVDSTRRELDLEVQKLVGATLNEYQTVRDAEQRTAKELARKKSEAFALNEKEIGYNRLLRQKENLERIYGMIVNRSKEAGLSGEQTTNNVQVVDRATVPWRPVKPRLTFSLTIAALFGLLLGVALAFLLEFLDNTVKTKEDIEADTGQTFLGIIPLIAERAAAAKDDAVELYLLANPRGHVAEACRAIRTNLLFMSPEQPLRRIVVTSAGPREGKTTTVVDLGVVMAQGGSTVCLIDTDMRRPRLHRVFGIEAKQGLSNLILGDVELDDVLQKTQVEGLEVLPCGPIPPNPAELLHTERFARILEQLGERFDRVILDTPPLTAVADAKVLAVASDGVIVIAKAHATTREMLASTTESLLDVNARILGVVLNQVDVERREYGGYYYRYYRNYGAYYGEDAETSTEAS
ncbi:MAG: polysaccharide biosynthesis tyrosine autokinase [Deltaproteobacteria bacterium]|nr:polysaccharide biosynthesis tyrosine autokinase [Deltaproteobacteria bacterium]